MKTLSFLTLMIFCSALAFSQSKKMAVCCSNPSATQKFAMLASDKKFVLSHPNPKPYHFQSTIGKAITYKTPDGKEANGFEIKAKKSTNNWLLVVHEWYGLNDFIKHESEKLYNDLGDV